MSALTPLALTFADILRHLATTDVNQTHAVIAKATGRDTSNTRRDMGKLAEAGLVVGMGGDPPRYILTNAGGRAVSALERAETEGTATTGLPVWPLDQIAYNPDNPRKSVSADFIDGLADTIVEADGLLQAIILYPADASGVRMLHAGEQRVRACRELAAQGRLPAALAEGLPFTERAPTRAEALFIGLVENSQRAGLSPWEDAQGLRAYADETGLSARAIAFKTGRAREGSEKGVGDVQQKIKTARKATPAAIKLHEDGLWSWEQLRDSTREARAISPHAALALVELRAKIEDIGRDGNDEISTCWVLSDGQGASWASHRELLQAEMIEDRASLLHGVLSPLVRITEAGLTWLGKACPADANRLAQGDDDETLNYLRQGWGRMEGREPIWDQDEGYTTPWLNARHLQEQLERRRSGAPEKVAEQVDLEEAIAATLTAAKPLVPFVPPDLLLAVAEGWARYLHGQGCHPHKVRQVEMTTSYPSVMVKRLANSGLGAIVTEPAEPGRIRTYLEVSPKGVELVKDLSLDELRAKDGVGKDRIAVLRRTGNYATPWLTWPKPAPTFATLPPSAPDTAASKGMDLSAKQVLLLAELADFRWRFPGGEHLAPGPHGGAHGLDKTLPALVVFTGVGGREGFRLTQAGVKELERLGLGGLTHIDDGAPGSRRASLLQHVREKVIKPERAADMIGGEYCTPWLNTDLAKKVADGYRAKAVEKARLAEFGTINDRVMGDFTQRLHGVVGMAAQRRANAGEPAVDPREIPELADLVISEMLAGNPFIACGHLAMIHLKRALAGLSTTATDAAVRAAAGRWVSEQIVGDEALLTLRKGDLVQKYIGGATTFRLLGRPESNGPRVSFRAQTIRNGKDYGQPVGLALSEITGVLHHAEAEPEQSGGEQSQTEGEEDHAVA